MDRPEFTEFRSRIQDVRLKDHDDLDLLKWLRARSFDVRKAEEMYRKSMTWRAEIGADTILETFQIPEVLQKFYPGGQCGLDKEGRPLWIDPLGRGDIRGIINSTKKTDIILFIVYRMEELHANFRQISKTSGRRVDQCTQIIDMEGFGPKIFWKPALDLYGEILQILESNYPETLNKTYIIKAPRVFNMGWNLLKAFIDKNTAEKFKFLGSDYATHLLRVADEDQLPQYYGGSRTDPDGNEKCEQSICYGGDVPKEMYKSKDDIFPPDVERTVITLGRRGTFTVGVQVPDAKHVISYVFAVDHGKLDYGVFCQKPGASDNNIKAHDNDVSDMDEVLPMRAVDCSRVPEDGFIFLDNPGQYFIHFKNTSVMYKKTLTYVIRVMFSDKQNIRDADVSIVTSSHEHTEL